MVPFSRFAIAVVAPQIVVGIIRWVIHKTYRMDIEDPEDEPINKECDEEIKMEQ